VQSNELQIFNNHLFGEIRTIEIDGKPYGAATDIARALGYSNPHEAILRHCKGITKREGVSRTTNQHGTTTSQTVTMNFIPEGDIYRLIANSKLPAAEKFASWVFDEVLPSIRKHGAYMTSQTLEEMIANPDAMIKVLTALKDEREKSRGYAAQIEAEKPEVVFAKAVSASDNAILIGELAKLLKQNGVEIGQFRLFEKLRQDGYLIKRKGTDYNMPTQRSMELGLFRVKQTAITHSDGHISISKTTKVTGKGQIYFINLFKKELPDERKQSD